MHGISLFSIIDFLAVFTGAVGGAIEARRDQRHSFDIVGVLGLGFTSALGGGITRDVLISHGPPLAFQDPRYLVLAVAGAAAGLVVGSSLAVRIRVLLLIADAAALGLFAVAGATRGIDAGLSLVPALLLGIVTAVGGGALRDVLSGQAPRIFERGELNAIVATIAATVFLLALAGGITRPTATALGSITGFAMRLMSVRFGWRTRSVRRP